MHSIEDGQKEIERVAIVGSGVIGASWVAQYLAAGLDVIASDPASHAEAALRAYLVRMWPALESLGLAPGACMSRLRFADSMQQAVADADFVHESGPERPDFKIKLFKEMDSAAPPEAILASSSAALTMSMMQSQCTRPDRCVIAHPLNPPHLMPLVEVVGGNKTSRKTLDRTMAFFRRIGKQPILLKKEIAGHVANRLQAALLREVVSLLAAGVVDVEEVDAAVCWGPGLAWGLMGPNLLLHLAGGAGGISHTLDHLSARMGLWWKDLEAPTEITPRIRAIMIKGMRLAPDGNKIDELAEQRDQMLLRLLELRRSARSPI